MLTRTGTQLLFPTRLVRFMVDAPALDTAIAAEILERSRTLPSVTRGERTGWQSANDLFQWSPETAALGKLVADAVMTAHDHVLHEIALFAWANVFARGVYFNPHVHADSAWSGVYYLDAGDSSDATGGLLMLRDPRAGAGMTIAASNAFDTASAYEIRPRTGELLIFPAWLVHWVTPYQSDRPRISVAFNAR